jgi:hypothetical protein
VYRKNTLKQRLANGENVLGCWTMLGHPQVVEILSLAGFDYLVLDQEHGLGDPSTLAAQLHAMSATPTVGVVRVPWNDHVYLKRVLDMGAEAVLIPSIDTADEARAAGRRLPLPHARASRDGGELGARVELRDGAGLCRDLRRQSVDRLPDRVGEGGREHRRHTRRRGHRPHLHRTVRSLGDDRADGQSQASGVARLIGRAEERIKAAGARWAPFHTRAPRGRTCSNAATSS